MSEISTSVLVYTLIILIILSAFFSSSETGLMALNRYRLKHLADKGIKSAQLARSLLKRPDRILGLILIGNNVVNFVAAAIGTVIGYRLYGAVGAAASPFVITFIFLVFAEVTPKTMAALRPERIALPASYIYAPSLKLLYPMVWLINTISNGLLRLFRINPHKAHSDALNPEELRAVVNEARHFIPGKHAEMLLGILDLENISVEDLCNRLKISFTRVDVNELNIFFKKKAFDHIMIAGAGLLPEDLANNHKIINAHPGYLPNMKGLDAFKWAIYNKQPIGVTTHYISDKADEGILIERRIVPVYFEDTFHNVAFRVYETEIEMLVNSIHLIENNLLPHELLNDNRFTANKRMPHNYELIMMNCFEEIRKKSKSNRD